MNIALYVFLASMTIVIIILYIFSDVVDKKSAGKEGYKRATFFTISFSDLNKAAIAIGNDRTTLMNMVRRLGIGWTYDERSHPWLAEITYKIKEGELVFIFPWQERDEPSAVNIFYRRMKASERRQAAEVLMDLISSRQKPF